MGCRGKKIKRDVKWIKKATCRVGMQIPVLMLRFKSKSSIHWFQQSDTLTDKTHSQTSYLKSDNFIHYFTPSFRHLQWISCFHRRDDTQLIFRPLISLSHSHTCVCLCVCVCAQVHVCDPTLSPHDSHLSLHLFVYSLTLPLFTLWLPTPPLSVCAVSFLFVIQ